MQDLHMTWQFFFSYQGPKFFHTLKFWYLKSTSVVLYPSFFSTIEYYKFVIVFENSKVK